MEGFIKDISNVYWWLSVVIVGVIINIISSWIKQKMDKTIGLYSYKRKVKLEKEKQTEVEEINEIAKTEFRIIIKFLEEFRYRFLTLLFLICSNIFALIAFLLISFKGDSKIFDIIVIILSILCLLFAAISSFIGLKTQNSVIKHKNILSNVLENKYKTDE